MVTATLCVDGPISAPDEPRNVGENIAAAAVERGHAGRRRRGGEAKAPADDAHES